MGRGRGVGVYDSMCANLEENEKGWVTRMSRNCQFLPLEAEVERSTSAGDVRV